jgi:hypothetical protein
VLAGQNTLVKSHRTINTTITTPIHPRPSAATGMTVLIRPPCPVVASRLPTKAAS